MRTRGMSSGRRGAFGAAILVTGVAMAFAASATATEIVPSIGWSKTVDGNGDAKVFGGLALRSEILPMVKGEVAAGYRKESLFAGALEVKQWPVTASLYFTPLSMLYAGAGVGWYHTSYDYADDQPTIFQDDTSDDFGVHLGGGLQMPLTPAAAIDFNGKYVMLRETDSRLVPQRFDPDFWSASVGLAIRF